MRTVAIGLAAILLCGSIEARAAWTGEQVVEYCKSNDPRLDGYIAGWREKHLTDSIAMLSIKKADMASAYGNKMRDIAFKSVTVEACPPQAMTNEQIRDAVCTYALAFPGGDNKEAQNYIIKALREIAPCRN